MAAARNTSPNTDGSAVPLTDISDFLGYPESGVVRNRAERDGYAVITDWKGIPALAYADARALVAAMRAEADDLRDKNQAYSRYVDEQRELASAKLHSDAAARRVAQRDRLAIAAARGAEELAAERARVSAENAREDEKFNGRLVGFESFKTGNR